VRYEKTYNMKLVTCPLNSIFRWTWVFEMLISGLIYLVHWFFGLAGPASGVFGLTRPVWLSQFSSPSPQVIWSIHRSRSWRIEDILHFCLCFSFAVCNWKFTIAVMFLCTYIFVWILMWIVESRRHHRPGKVLTLKTCMFYYIPSLFHSFNIWCCWCSYNVSVVSLGKVLYIAQKKNSKGATLRNRVWMTWLIID